MVAWRQARCTLKRFRGRLNTEFGIGLDTVYLAKYWIPGRPDTEFGIRQDTVYLAKDWIPGQILNLVSVRLPYIWPNTNTQQAGYWIWYPSGYHISGRIPDTQQVWYWIWYPFGYRISGRISVNRQPGYWVYYQAGNRILKKARYLVNPLVPPLKMLMIQETDAKVSPPKFKNSFNAITPAIEETCQLYSFVFCVVVVYHVTIVAIGHWLLKKFWPLILGCVLHSSL